MNTLQCLVLTGVLVTSAIRLTAQESDWNIHFGDVGDDQITSVAVSALDGHVYVTGTYHMTILPDPSDPAFELNALGETPFTVSTSQDVFLCAYTQEGEFLWGHSIGSESDDAHPLVRVDGNGQVTVLVSIGGQTDADPGPGVQNFNVFGDGMDILISRFTADGSWLWSKKIGGNLGDEIAEQFLVEESGRLIIAGTFQGTVDFNPGNGVFSMSSTPESTARFVVCLDNDGNFQWANRYGALSSLGITLNNAGILLVGSFNGTEDFNPGPEVFTLNAGGPNDKGYFSQLSPEGVFIQAFLLGTSGTVNLRGAVAIDSGYYIYGTMASAQADVAPGIAVVSTELFSTAETRGIIVRIDEDFNYQWHHIFSSTQADLYISSACAGPSQGACFGGWIEGGAVFDTEEIDAVTPGAGYRDAFILEVSETGNIVWAGMYGGQAWDSVHELTQHEDGLFIAGFHEGWSVDLNPVSPSEPLSTPGSEPDAHLIRMINDPCSEQAPIEFLLSGETCDGPGIISYTFFDTGVSFQLLPEEIMPCSGCFLSAGTYSVMVTDDSGCAWMEEITVAPYFSACAGDFDGDGIVGTYDMLGLIGSFGCTSGCCPFDLDQNEQIGINDLILFNSIFGAICEQ